MPAGLDSNILQDDGTELRNTSSWSVSSQDLLKALVEVRAKDSTEAKQDEVFYRPAQNQTQAVPATA